MVWFKVLLLLRRGHNRRVQGHDIERILSDSMVARREGQIMLIDVSAHLIRWGRWYTDFYSLYMPCCCRHLIQFAHNL